MMWDDVFIKEVYENAIHRGFTYEEVLDQLRKFSDKALILEETQDA